MAALDLLGHQQAQLEALCASYLPDAARELVETLASTHDALRIAVREMVGGLDMHVPTRERLTGMQVRTNRPLNQVQIQQRQVFMDALVDCYWVQKDAARKVGVTTRVFNYQMKRLGIERPKDRR